MLVQRLSTTNTICSCIQVRPGNLSQDDAVQITFLLLVAGNATMVNIINLGVVTLFEYPEQLKELKKDPSLAHNFVEELCRYHQGSAMATRRVAKIDVEYGGKVSPPKPRKSIDIRRGTSLVLTINSLIPANQSR